MNYSISKFGLKRTVENTQKEIQMNVTASELKKNLGKFLKLAADENIYITKNGKRIALLTSPIVDKNKVLDSLIGIIPGEATVDEIKEERLKRQ